MMLFSGCSIVQVRDQEVCGDMGSQGASCVHTLTQEKRDIGFNDWDDIRFGWLCMSPATFADQKRLIEFLCQISHRCILPPGGLKSPGGP